jgi:hypothetical protein
MKYKNKLKIFENAIGLKINHTLFDWKEIGKTNENGQFVYKYSTSIKHNTDFKANYPLFKSIHIPFKIAKDDQ